MGFKKVSQKKEVISRKEMADLKLKKEQEGIAIDSIQAARDQVRARPLPPHAWSSPCWLHHRWTK
jgi:hypothetical protein